MIESEDMKRNRACQDLVYTIRTYYQEIKKFQQHDKYLATQAAIGKIEGYRQAAAAKTAAAPIVKKPVRPLNVRSYQDLAQLLFIPKKKKSVKSKATVGTITDEDEPEIVENDEAPPAATKSGTSNTVRLTCYPSFVEIMLSPPKPRVKMYNDILNQFFPVAPGEVPPSVDSFRFGVRGTLEPASVNILLLLCRVHYTV